MTHEKRDGLWIALGLLMVILRECETIVGWYALVYH